ncbi:MAG: NAD(P)-dependent oxidoreductase [Methylococcaceae bacterium]|nr:NAD(P)-dependent oxidoreductase [Methylococcaceae bacterium]MCI0666631.1 NAD(P)-dependent oxidoreductase [Methylococcaceae bacterium]MCI0733384.1 NAD(P)-dependent oxidoreductase [Methylococcaceae bacterium]
MQAGFIGLGAMGASMARNIAASGQLSAVWNRSPSIALRFASETGVQACANPAGLGALCEVVCICVSADPDVLEVVGALSPGLKTGSVVVDFSTVSADTARRTAEILEQRAVSFLDSPVSGGVEGARNGALAMMVGGDQNVLQRVMPILKTMGKRIVHMGPVGAGQSTKAVNQIMAAGINQAVSEALAFGEYQELPVERLIEVIASGAAGNWFLEHRGLSMTHNRFNPGFKLKLHHKDLLICRDMARKLSFVSRVIESTIEDYARLMEQGHGDDDISALYRLKRPR